MSETAQLERDVRVEIARQIREEGRVPTIADVAAVLGRSVEGAEAAFGRLADAHVFIARHGSHEIYAYNPFCAEPTGFRVDAGQREWWGICGWDALGIPAALGMPGVLEATCADCAEPVRIEVTGTGDARSRDRVVLHVGVPAREFWKDIYFT